MSYPFPAQLHDTLYQLHVVWSWRPSWCACMRDCKTGL